MEFALDYNGKRIDAWNKNEMISADAKYFCPSCGNPVIYRHGDIRIPHFAHESGKCNDEWNYDMSEWHSRMQCFFPEINREVVVNWNGKKHRADILVNDTVIEFQHSTITGEEFEDRNNFFMGLGYRVAWVFDVSGVVEEERIIESDYTNNVFRWKWPIQLAAVAPPINNKNEQFSLWLYLRLDCENDSGIRKVVWTMEDDDGYQSFKHFACSDYTLDLKRLKNLDLLFCKRGHGIQTQFKQAYYKLRDNMDFKIKYIAVKGHKRDGYICPKNQKFGIKYFKAYGCSYCACCGLVAHKKRKRHDEWTIYCCYPNRIRRVEDEDDPGYECSSIDEFII